MKRAGSIILRSAISSHTIQPDQPLVLTAERYSLCGLLLQRDILALHSGEAKVHYNTVQSLSKILLSESWLTKSLYNEL